MSRLKKYLRDGALMTASALVLRALSVALNSYLSKKIGAEALGLYTLLGTTYSLALTLALSGINLTVTRLVADALGKGSKAEARAAMRSCICYSIFFGTLSAALLLSLSKPLSVYVLKDIRTLKPLRLSAATLPLISLTSCFNGYFAAVRRVYKNAVTQISEQIARLTASVALLEFFFAHDMESACIALVLGGALSEMLSFTVSLTLFVLDKQIGDKKETSDQKSIQPRITRKMLSVALPLALSTYLRSALLSIEHILIPEGIEKSGADRPAALASYGTLQSMAMPLVLMPAAIIQSFSGLLIPELAELKIQNNKREIKYIAERVCHLAMIFATGASGIMICFARELGNQIYSSSEAGEYIGIVAHIVPIMYLDTTVDSMLKGIGEHMYTMTVNIIDTLCSLVMVSIFIPKLGIYGYIALIIISEIFNAGASIFRLAKVTGMRPKIGKCFLLPLTSAAIATMIMKISKTANKIGLIPSIIAWLISYAANLRISGGLNKKDIEYISNFFKKSP